MSRRFKLICLQPLLLSLHCGSAVWLSVMALLYATCLAPPSLAHAEPIRLQPPAGSARVLVVPQASAAPVVDGVLDDPAWREAARGDGFWISLENRHPSEKTEVLVTADAKNIYFGFRSFDSQPDQVEALQTRRDSGLALDDRVTVELDPFRSFNADATSKFSVNARGTQYDEIGSGRARQLSWKGDWKAATQRTPEGWTAEIAIPFAILNYERKSDTFAVNFFRYHHRTKELSQWADTTPQNLPEEIGRLAGLVLPQQAKRRVWTFLPYLFAGKNVRSAGGRTRKHKIDSGFEARYEPRPNLTALVSVNPDLSQIEKAVTDINFSYNEKSVTDYRPFFQEGATYFGGNQSYYFYSNRIPDINLGGRAFGRINDTQFGSFVTSSPDGRIDYFAQATHQFDKTHALGAAIVASDRRGLNNVVYALEGKGREVSGLNYAFEAAATKTQGAVGDGNYTKGKVGWNEDFWSASITLDRYSTEFFPANGIVDRDVLGTRGGIAAAGFYRDFGSGPLYNMQGNAYWQVRRTNDGDLQKNYAGVSGSIETRSQVRLTLGYTAGRYRPPGEASGTWAPDLNNDHYLTVGVDLNTRSDRLSYGASLSDGVIADSDYRYLSAYVRTRPSAVTYLNLSFERLSYFGRYDQWVVTGGWDVTPKHNVSARLIHAYYGDSLRTAWTWRIGKNVDLFAVYEAFSAKMRTKDTISVKLVLTLP